SSGTATTLATIVAVPSERSAAVSPISSSPALTSERPDSQAERTQSDGGVASDSRSYTVSGPSASVSEEKSGLSARNEPWAARWATSAASSAASTSGAVAARPDKGSPAPYRAATAAPSARA